MTPSDRKGGGMKGMVSMLVLSMGLVAMACGEEEDKPEELGEKDAALRMMVNAEGAKEVEQAKWRVSSCDGVHDLMDEKEAVDRWTHEVTTPSHIGEDDLFMEEYLEVPGGCYDVEINLQDSQGAPVSECTTVRGAQVEVNREETAEMVLFSRCDGVDDEPKVEMLRFEPTAFVECDQKIEICATVNSDGLGVALDWKREGDVSLAQPIEAGNVESLDDRVEQCARWVPRHHGETQGRLRAISSSAEVMDGGDVVLFADPHKAWFSTFMECREAKGEKM